MKNFKKFYVSSDPPNLTKEDEESTFWRNELLRYIDWYDGKLTDLYGQKPPTNKQKVKVRNKKDSAILTWFELHQKPKYLKDLMLEPGAFKGSKLLDVGAGPMPSALAYKDIELYCLDPLYSQYLADGYPMHYYGNAHFINSPAEYMPISDNFFDAVIAINAIDHVNDFGQTAQEIKRVLKPDGKFAMHVHYHQATPAEPIELNDNIFLESYGWCKNLKKINESVKKTGWEAKDGELYVIWRNF